MKRSTTLDSVGEGFYATITADTITLDGSLQLQLLYGFVPQDGDTFTIINAANTLTGTFDGLPEGALVDRLGDFAFYISYATNAVTLRAEAIANEGEGEGEILDSADAIAARLLEGFTTWDLDENGQLSREEILARIRTLLGGKGVEGESLEGEDAEANALFEELDKNSDDQLSVGELRQTAGALSPVHASDQNADGDVSLSELLRLIQFYNAEAYGCAENPGNTEDGYDTGAGDESCLPHTSDYLPEDFIITLSELLRAIQFYNSGGLTFCPEESSEDNFCPTNV